MNENDEWIDVDKKTKKKSKKIKKKKSIIEQKTSIRKHWKTWAEKSTIYGIPEFTEGSKIKKLILSLILLLAFVATVWYIQVRIADYSKFESFTFYRKKYTTEKTLPFPAVTVCNDNRYYFNEDALRTKLLISLTSLDILLKKLNYTGPELNVADILYASDMDWMSDIKTDPEIKKRPASYRSKIDNKLDTINTAYRRYFNSDDFKDEIIIAQTIMNTLSLDMHIESEKTDANGDFDLTDWDMKDDFDFYGTGEAGDGFAPPDGLYDYAEDGFDYEVYDPAVYQDEDYITPANFYDADSDYEYDPDNPDGFGGWADYDPSDYITEISATSLGVTATVVPPTTAGTKRRKQRDLETIFSRQRRYTDVFENFNITKIGNITVSKVLKTAGFQLSNNTIFEFSFRKVDLQRLI